MSCNRAEEFCAALAGGAPGGEGAAELRRHAASCPECAGLLSVLEFLREAAPAFAVPDPHPAYWVRFSGRLESELAAGAGRRWWLPPAPARARFALALGSLAIFAVSLLIFRAGVPVGGRISRALPPAAVAGSIPAEEELLGRLGLASEARLDEALDAAFPVDPFSAPSELAEAEIALPKELEGAATSGEEYDLLYDLEKDERDHFLKELRGEIG